MTPNLHVSLVLQDPSVRLVLVSVYLVDLPITQALDALSVFHAVRISTMSLVRPVLLPLVLLAMMYQCPVLLVIIVLVWVVKHRNANLAILPLVELFRVTCVMMA